MSIKLSVTGPRSGIRSVRCSLDQHNRIDISTRKNKKWKFADIDLTPLGACHDLEVIKISGNGLKQIDLSPLSHCTKLKTLEITSQKNLQAIDLSPLSSCTKLRFLELNYCSLNHIDLKPLSSCNIERLWLDNNRLQNVNLSPLSSFEFLSVIVLSDNLIRSIDLSPLEECDSFRSLFLDGNQLERIDLSPLGSCHDFAHLNISQNRLKSIDLSPLGSCHDFAHLNISQNRLESLDLSPLASCKLVSLSLGGNPIDEADITPVLLNPSLKRVSKTGGWVQTRGLVKDPYTYQRDVECHLSGDALTRTLTIGMSWEVLHRLALIPQSTSISIQDYILQTLGLHDFGIIDSDILDSLQSIPPQTSLEEARKIVRPIVVEKICEQIDRGGTTIRLNVESVSSNHEEIAKRIQRVAELRESEMKSVRIFLFHIPYFWSEDCTPEEEKETERYSIRELALTACGFSILSMADWLTEEEGVNTDIVSKKIFTLIDETVKSLGYEVPVIEDEDHRFTEYETKNMSRQMRNYVLDLVKMYSLFETRFFPEYEPSEESILRNVKDEMKPIRSKNR